MEFDGRLSDLLKKVGIPDGQIKDILDELKGTKSGLEIAGELGQILGKFLDGAASGAKGVPIDPGLISKLLEALGPVAQDLIRGIVERLKGNSDGYAVSFPGPQIYKLQKTKKKSNNAFEFSLDDGRAPDVSIVGTPNSRCVGDHIEILLGVRVSRQAEPIKHVMAEAYDISGQRIGVDLVFNGERGLPARGNQETDSPFAIDLTVRIECVQAFKCFGGVTIAVAAQDHNGDLMYDFVIVDVTRHLLQTGNCCSALNDDDTRLAIKEGFKKALDKVTPADAEKLIARIVCPSKRLSSSGVIPTPKAFVAEVEAVIDPQSESEATVRGPIHED
jgi:hypothetical protein